MISTDLIEVTREEGNNDYTAMYTKILGQPSIKSKVQNKHTDGFTYSFITNLKKHDIKWADSWNLVERVIIKCLSIIVGMDSNEMLNLKNLELSVDIPSGNYTIRFSSAKDLGNLAYAFELLWLVDDDNNCFDDFPYDYMENHKIAIKISPVLLDDIEKC